MFKFYLSKRSVNNATSHYISLIERTIEAIGSTSERVFSVSNIKRGDIVITVEAKDFFIVNVLKPSNKKINWFQGITPEEAMMVYRNPLRKLIWEIFEKYTLSRSVLNIFVSKSMHKHYKFKYAYKNSNSIEMPCYNKQLNKNSFFLKNKYTSPSFVYSGNLSSWQCINEVFEVFNKIELALPHARLLILTSETEMARFKAQKFKTQNVEIKHVPVGEIGEHLSSFKYGFILRKDHIVNHVATPTKMNTYLAYGVIPVFSNVIDAFKENIELEDYELRISPDLNIEEISKKIVGFEKNINIDPERYSQLCERIFSSYYNDEIYIQDLGEIFKKLIKL